MRIVAFTGGPLATIGYLVYDQDEGTAMMIDAPLGSTRGVVDTLERHGLTLRYLVNTHGHWHNIADNVPLTTRTGAEICAHVWDMTRLAHPEFTAEEGDQLVALVQPSRADVNLHGGELLEAGALRLEVLHTPGHSPGSVCIYAPAAAALFTGDTIYKSGVGSTNIPGGNKVHLEESLRKLAGFADGTRIYPARSIPTLMKDERWLLELAAV